VTFSVTAGTTYQIAVDGYLAASGNITLRVTPPVAQVATPTLSPASGATFTSTLNVTASTSTAGATVRYTINGSDPTSSSSTTAPTLTATANVKARAFKSGMTDSAVASGTYTKLQVAMPTLNPASGTTFRGTLTVNASTTTPLAILRYTIDGTTPTASSAQFPSIFGLVVSNTVMVKVRGFSLLPFPFMLDSSDVATATYTAQPVVVLLLHGMNSEPDTWNDFMRDSGYFDTILPIAPVIYNIQVEGGQSQWPTIDRKGVRYYRVKFGAFDNNSGRSGVEDVRPTSPGPQRPPAGDFTSFSGTSSLAEEVRDAIKTILSRHANAKILLVGHSRGGIAGRAFLQTTTTSYTTERNAVVGLLTVGTPHLGSPFGGSINFWQTIRDLPIRLTGCWLIN